MNKKMSCDFLCFRYIVNLKWFLKKGEKMNCFRLRCVCRCGSYTQPLSLWITDQKSLQVTSYCVSCESQFCVLFPLSELFKSCPCPTPAPIEEKSQILLPRAPEHLTTQDARFLRALKIDPWEGGL